MDEEEEEEEEEVAVMEEAVLGGQVICWMYMDGWLDG